MQIQAPKGTKDVLPGESYKWQYIEKKCAICAACTALTNCARR